MSTLASPYIRAAPWYFSTLEPPHSSRVEPEAEQSAGSHADGSWGVIKIASPKTSTDRLINGLGVGQAAASCQHSVEWGGGRCESQVLRSHELGQKRLPVALLLALLSSPLLSSWVVTLSLVVGSRREVCPSTTIIDGVFRAEPTTDSVAYWDRPGHSCSTAWEQETRTRSQLHMELVRQTMFRQVPPPEAWRYQLCYPLRTPFARMVQRTQSRNRIP